MRGWATQYLSDPRTWVVLAGLTALACLAARPLASRTNAPAWAVLGTLLSAAVVVSLTLPPAPGQALVGPNLAVFSDCLRSLVDPGDWLRGLFATQRRGERVGNVLMFVPVCAFAVLATRRPALVAVIGLLAPAAIEVGQAVIGGGRDCAADDWLNNGTGALIGVAAGAVVLTLTRPRT